MIIRTEHGYKLNDWECCPMRLPNGAKLTPGESRAVICRINGLTHKQAAAEMHVTKASISQYWQTIYYKLHTSSAMTVITKLMQLDALKRTALLLALVTFCNSSFGIQDFERVTRKTASQSRSGRLMRNACRGYFSCGGNAALPYLDELTNGSASEVYTLVDVQGMA